MSEIRVNNIIDEAGTGAPTFPNGATGNLTGNVTGTATTATALSGTPNITVGTVTGTDATFSGNLTVQGTTTTIDTAVTAVDSLAVDGNIGIGTTSPLMQDGNSNPVVHLYAASSPVEFRAQRGDGADAFFTARSQELQIGTNTNHRIEFRTNDTERLRIHQHGITKFKGPLAEKCHYDTGGGLQSDYHHDLITHGNVYWSDTAAAGAFTFNLRGSASVALNDMMDTGESLSFWLAHACHSDTTRYLTAFKVDGTTISGGNIIWAGGSAPTAAGGGSGTKDVYTFTVFKVGNSSFRAFAALTNHA
jgi:hypothetical protein